MKTKLNQKLDKLTSRVCADPFTEKAWLRSNSNLEYLAAEHIRNNITKNTPDEVLEDIEAHAQEEDGHGDILMSLAEGESVRDCYYSEIEYRFKEITRSFLNGFFGNELLFSLKNRHAAYVHGALTIEMLPFLVYSSYLKFTKHRGAKKAMPQVIKDESDHIQLGRELRKGLGPHQKVHLKDLNRILHELSLMKVERMNRLLDEVFLNKPLASFERQICQNDLVLTAWCWSLTRIMKNHELWPAASINKIRKSLLLKNRAYSSDLDYINLTSWFERILTENLNSLNAELVRHFSLLAHHTYNINLAYAIESTAKPFPLSQKEAKLNDSLRVQVLDYIKDKGKRVEIKRKWA